MTTLGKLRNQVYTKLSETYSNKEEFKKTLKMFMSVLNENKDLSKVFNIYTDMENKYISSEEVASEFITEAVNEIKSLMSENYMSGINKLETIFGSVVCNENEYTKNLDTLVHKTGYDTLIERIESKGFFVDKLTESRNLSENYSPVTQSILNHVLTSKFNDKFEVMTESEKESFLKYRKLTTLEINESIIDLKNQISESISTLKDNKELSSLISEVEGKVTNSGNDLLSLIKLEELNSNLI